MRKIIFSLIVILLLTAVSPLLFAAERVVSLSPNLTEIIYNLGRGEVLVGRSSACDYPPEVKKLPVAGDYGRVFAEPLLALKPTLVVTEKTWNDSIAQNLRKFNIRHLVFSNDTLEDYLTATAELGKELKADARATEIICQTRNELKWLEAETKGIPEEKRPRVLVVIGETPVFTAGRKSFINDMIELAGGRNIAASQNQRYFACSLEWVIEQQPEILIMPGASPEKVRAFTSRAAIKDLPAVKNNRILTDIDEAALYRLGPRTLDGIRVLKQYFSGKSSAGRTQK